MRHTITKTTTGVALAASVLLGAATSAYATDCYNTSRSATGATEAGTHSKTQSEVLDVRVVAAEGAPEMGIPNPGLTAAQQATFLSLWQAQGHPLVFTVMALDPFGFDPTTGAPAANPGGQVVLPAGGEVANQNPNMDSGLGSNGTGIDHFDQTGQQLMTDLFNDLQAAAATTG